MQNVDLSALDQAIQYDLELPRRVWMDWDRCPEATAKNARVEFRSPAFVTDGAPGSWRLSLTASGPVSILIDGKTVVEESVTDKADPSYWRVRHYDLDAYLSAGEHRIEFSVLAGMDTPYLLACLDRVAGSVNPLAAPEVLERCWVTGESFEVRLPGEDAWQGAMVFEGVWAEPTGLAVNAPDDWGRLSHGRQRISHGAMAVVSRHEGVGGWQTPEAENRLRANVSSHLIRAPRLGWEDFNETMFHLKREDFARELNQWLAAYRYASNSMVFDAGEECFGRLVFHNPGEKTVQLAVITGESVEELSLYGRAMSTLWTLAPGERVTTPLIGFRYAELIALAAEDGQWQLTMPVVQSVLHDAPVRGNFQCSDDVINRVWDVGTHTVHLCGQDQIWDAIKRDLLPWMGDLHMENLVWLTTLGDKQLPELSLRANRETCRLLERPYAARQIPSLSKGWGLGTKSINGIPSYTAWWLVAMHDYVMLTGDLELLKDEADELPLLADLMASCVREDGSWDWEPLIDLPEYGPNRFVDHSILTEEEETLAMLAIVVAGLRGVSALFELLGREMENWSAAATRATAFLKARLSKAQPGSLHRQAFSVAAALGVVDGSSVKDHLDVADDNLRTPWWRSYELGAALEAGRIDWMLNEIRAFWGDMVSHGQTSLWECHKEAWMTLADPHGACITREDGKGYGGHRISQSHGWGAGPSYYLLTGVLGVKPLEPGYKRFLFEPNLGDLEWAEGNIPTPVGEIYVRLERKGSEVVTHVEAPEGLEMVTSVTA